MADFTLTVPEGRFASGASAAVYPASNWAPHKRPPSGAPVGSTATSATVTAGSVAFTGLDEDTRYYAYQLVGEDHRYMPFSTFTDVPAAQQPYVVLTQAAYDALDPPDPQTLYVIQD